MCELCMFLQIQSHAYVAMLNCSESGYFVLKSLVSIIRHLFELLDNFNTVAPGDFLYLM